MNQIQRATSQSVALPDPGVPIAFRVGTLDDLPAIDALQKQYHKELGFFPRAQMEGYLRNGWVLVAKGSGQWPVAGGQLEKASLLTTDHRPPTTRLLGYCVSRDRYLKRDELGVIFQLCVEPGVQRKFIGAALLREVFERSPYGCRLYCCWCAQDLSANRFWESMGFVPLAFRSGSAKRGKKGGARVHIFWQKRIVAGDATTPYWFPSSTGGGSIREDRIVLPIPSGTHWSDAEPIVLPGEPAIDGERALPAPKERKRLVVNGGVAGAKQNIIATGGLRFGTEPTVGGEKKKAKQPRPARKPGKNNPALALAARELRDRWMERVNAETEAFPAIGKYEVYRELQAVGRKIQAIAPLLDGPLAA